MTTALAIGTYEDDDVFFQCVDPSTDHGVYQRQRNQADFEFWMNHQPPNNDVNFETWVRELAAKLGMSLTRVRNLVMCFQRIVALPLLVELQRNSYHLDLDRLITIDRSLKGVNDEHLPTMDAFLVKLLTPIAPHEILRQPRAIRQRIIRKLTEIDPEAVEKRQQEKRGATVTALDDNTRIGLTFTNAEALEVITVAKKMARKHKLPIIDAFKKMMTEGADVKAVLNLVPNEAGLLDLIGAGPLSQNQVETWLPRVTHARVIHYNMNKNAALRFFGAGSQAFIAGRDGHCMGPNCSTDALHCDADHTNNFDGTNTDPINADKLCPPCHQEKTDKRFTVTSVNTKGVKTFTTSDGDRFTVLPDGPLVHTGDKLTTPEEVRASHDAQPPERNLNGFAQSMKQKLDKQRKDRRASNLRAVD